jgi:alpha-galactosidase
VPKITLIGAGSTVFARNLMGDILSFPELANCTLALHDIDEERLRTSEIVGKKLAAKLGAHPKFETTIDRRAALDGADYAITMFQVGGYEPGTVVDFEIPKKYGLRQTIGDTLGVGGIMRALRTIPVLLEMCQDMEELCPDALLLNYVNPMAMLCWALNEATTINSVGLCHSVFLTARDLAHDIGLPLEEINYLCAGINHMAFFLNYERDGQDLYPQIRKVIDEGRVPEWNQVRYEICDKLGYFVAESSEHFAEYVPWFIKRDRPDLIERFNIPLDEYPNRCILNIRTWELMKQKLETGVSPTPEQVRSVMDGVSVMPFIATGEKRRLEAVEGYQFSHEYGSEIIHSMETGTPRVVYGNVPNEGLIDNLPQDCIVEVPCLVDKNGVQPARVGRLPLHLAALMQTNINVQALTVEAALTGKRDAIYHAAMLDPHTAAELDLDQIWNLVDDLIEAHGDWLPAYH